MNYSKLLDAQTISEALGGKRSGKGFTACCPAHDDKHPSLSISDGNNTILVHCFAGCPQQDVIAALKDRGLWPEATKEQRTQAVRRRTQTEIDHARTVLQIADSDIKNGIELGKADKAIVRAAIKVVESQDG